MDWHADHYGTASNAATEALIKSQSVESLEKDNSILYDLVDLMNIFKVSKRTIFNWRAKGVINLICIGGKLYMTHKMLQNLVTAKGCAI